MAGLWWVSEVVNHVGLYGSKVAEGCWAFQCRSCLFSHRSHIYWFFLKKLNMVSQHIGEKTNEYMNSAEQIPRNWNVDQLSVLITSWDITKWCSINLLWKELMECMRDHTGLISSYQVLITAACRNTGSKMKGSHSRVADRCPFVLRHSLSQVTSFMQLGMLWA